jgi:hypothetical protein
MPSWLCRLGQFDFPVQTARLLRYLSIGKIAPIIEAEHGIPIKRARPARFRHKHSSRLTDKGSDPQSIAVTNDRPCDGAITRPAGLFNALSERGGAGGAVKDVFPLFERSPV